MSAISMRKRGGRVSFFYLALLLLFLPGFVSAADKPATKSTSKSAKAKSAKSQSAKPQPSTSPQPVFTEETVRASFETFTVEWMGKLAQAEEYHRTQRVQITESADGFSAEYVGYLPQRYVEVKKTTSEETPFVGMLTYYERTLRCTRKTKEEALQGPFEQVEMSPVKEIFRFTRGKWVY